MKHFILGIVVGLAIPFLMDFVLFGDFTPCHKYIVHGNEARNGKYYYEECKL